MPKLIVFLGNPGVHYNMTRHNAGFLVCDHYCKETNLTNNWQTKFHALFIKSNNFILLKPQTYMNESGISVQECSKFFNITTKDIMIVHDDIELPFGETKVQLSGGLAGHNGLRSVKQHLKTDQFMRLRIGVGRPPSVMQVSDYVLGKFSPLEEKQLETILDSAVSTIIKYIKE